MMKIKIMGLVKRWRAEPIKGSDLSESIVMESATSNCQSKKHEKAENAERFTDTGLLPHVFDLWTRGQFSALAEIGIAQVQADIHRAVVLALIAMSHQRLGNQKESKNLTALSFEWAEDKNIVKNIVLSEAWLQLALCFKSANLQTEAESHLEKAIRYAPFTTDIQQSFETDESKISTHKISHRNSSDNNTNNYGLPRPDGKSLASIDQRLIQLSEKIDNQCFSLTKNTQELKKSIKSELENNTHQIEAFLDLQNFFNHGRHLPKMHGWPISPDLALYLVDLINSNSYDYIIEFGSGTSTLLIAQTLDIKSRSHQKNNTVKQIAFEHLVEYHDKTNTELKQRGLDCNVNLQLTPLEEASFTGGSYLYYSCDAILEELSSAFAVKVPKVLALVDGPPARTGKHARFPALPILLKYFPTAEIDIVLDDFARTEEKGVVSLWTTILEQSQEHTYRLDAIKMEKDACLISIRSAYS